MTFSPQNSLAPFLPTTTTLPQDPIEIRIRLTNFFNDVALKMNIREISNYEFVETLTGQTWPTPSPTLKKNTFRKLIPITIIGNATNVIPHGILDINVNFSFTKIFGSAKNATGTLFIPIPQSAPDDVSITIDTVNVYVTASTNTYNGFTGNLILEFLKN